MKNNTICCSWLPRCIKGIKMLTLIIKTNIGQLFPRGREDGEWDYSGI